MNLSSGKGKKRSIWKFRRGLLHPLPFEGNKIFKVTLLPSPSNAKPSYQAKKG